MGQNLALRQSDFDLLGDGEMTPEVTASLRQRLTRWGEELTLHLGSLGFRRLVFSVVFEPESHRVRARFERDLETQKQLASRDIYPKGGAYIELSLYTYGLWFGLTIPSFSGLSVDIDWRNLRARMLDADSALAFTSALETLSDPFVMGPLGRLEEPPSLIASDYVRTLLDNAEVLSVPFAMGVMLPVNLCVHDPEAVEEDLVSMAGVLFSLRELIAWNQENDLCKMHLLRPEEKVLRRSNGRSWDEREYILNRDEKNRIEGRESYSPKREPKSVTDGDGAAPLSSSAGLFSERKKVSPHVIVQKEKLPPSSSTEPNFSAFSVWERYKLNKENESKRRSERGSRRSKQEYRSIQVGARVELLSGLFVGKVGVVEQVSEKENEEADVKVRVGLLSTKSRLSQLKLVRDLSGRRKYLKVKKNAKAPILATSHLRFKPR